MSNAQAITNLQQDLEKLNYEDGDDWGKNLNRFHEILALLDTYGAPINSEERTKKIIRTFPPSLSPIAMTAEATNMNFETLVANVESEMSRRAKYKGTNSSAARPSASKAEATTGGIRSGGITKMKRPDVDCWVCGKHANYARDCWLRESNNETGGGTRWHSRIGGRGRGRGRGRARGRGGYNRHHSYDGHSGRDGQQDNIPQWRDGPPASGGNSYPDDAAPLSNQGPSLQANYHEDHENQRPPRRRQPPNSYGFMAKVKYRSSVAEIGNEKTSDLLIDSGATHNFLHSRNSFIEFEKIEPIDVRSASGVTKIVGKGTFLIPIDGGRTIDAFYVPQFTANILSVSKLTGLFNLLFTEEEDSVMSDVQYDKVVATENSSRCIISLRSGTVVKEVIYRDGLYALKQEKRTVKSICTTSCIICQAYRPTTLTTYHPISDAMEWHRRLGHPSPERMMALSRIIPDVPNFPLQALRNMTCPTCAIYKSRRSSIESVPKVTLRALERVHLDVLGKKRTQSLSGCHYALGIVDDFTSKTDVLFMSERSEVSRMFRMYMARSERVTGTRLQNIRLDRAGEHRDRIMIQLEEIDGVKIEWSSPYASQSNGIAERFMQELTTRARVLLNDAHLPENLWDYAMAHGNWLRNRLPCRRVNGNLPILAWKPNTNINLTIPTFEQAAFAFIYSSSTAPNKKFRARSTHGQFIGMNSDTRLCNVLETHSNNFLSVRLRDFRVCRDEQLPGLSSLLDGLARQSDIERHEGESDGAEEGLLQAFLATNLSSTGYGPHSYATRPFDPRVPKTFSYALKFSAWCAAIDREFWTLVKRGTWKCVERRPGMHVLPFTLVFKLKKLDAAGTKHLEKARCCVRGELQTPEIDFNPTSIYAPVASHEAIRILFSVAASEDLYIEGGDVGNAYLYGDIDVPVYMEQPTDSTGLPLHPGLVVQLLKSMYGLKQAGFIWGSLLAKSLESWGFRRSSTDARVMFKSHVKDFIILIIVVDDLLFASNSKGMIETFKRKLADTFDVKLFGPVSSFLGWEVKKTVEGINITQSRYAKEIVMNNSLYGCNGTYTPMAVNADLQAAQSDEAPLPSKQHATFRRQIGELLYLAVCTRPDIMFAVSALARSLHSPAQRHLKWSSV